MLKGQDIAILIKLLLKQKAKEKIEFKNIAYELYISQSEVTKSIKRLEKSKLISRYSDDSVELHKHELMELFLYGVKYLFPATDNMLLANQSASFQMVQQKMAKKQQKNASPPPIHSINIQHVWR